MPTCSLFESYDKFLSRAISGQALSPDNLIVSVGGRRPCSTHSSEVDSRQIQDSHYVRLS